MIGTVLAAAGVLFVLWGVAATAVAAVLYAHGERQTDADGGHGVETPGSDGRSHR